MSLDSEVKARWSNQLLVAASNPQNSTSTAIDQARLTAAETDVESMFKVLCGVAFDETDARHVAYAVEGVYVRLLVMTGQAPNDEWKAWKTELKEELALVTGRDRIVPSTNSRYNPTLEEANELPRADKSVFDNYYIPRNPGAGVQDRTSSNS